VTAWLTETLVAVSALMLLVLALRPLVARAFGAGWAYALWAIPALRLLLPPLGFVHLSVSPAGSLIPPVGGVTALPPAAAGPGQWVPFMLASWAGGAVIFLILQWLAYRTFVRRLREDARPARPPFFEGVATFVSRLVEGPLALGLLRPLIVIPADFSRRYSPAERRLAMAHERAHHRRGDLWWNVAALMVLAANWFNPIAWFAFRAFRTDQELACDAAVAARASAYERADYARALVKAATPPGLVAACSMSDTSDLMRRLRMLALHRASRIRSAGGLVALLTTGLAGFAVAAGAAPERPPVPKASAVRLAAAAPVARAQAIPAPRAEEEEGDRAPASEQAAPPRDVAPPPASVRPAVAPPGVGATSAEPAPAPAPQPPAVYEVTQRRFVSLDDLDPAVRARVEAAIARARASAESDRPLLRLAAAEAPVARTFVLRIHIDHQDQGE
jgi:bla regulator protein BlaR1